MAGKSQQGFRPLGQLVANLTHKLKAKRKPTAKTLARHWPDIVGADLAQCSAPERIARQGGEAALIVRADGGAGVEIQHMAGHILARISEITGTDDIRRIKVLHGPPGIGGNNKGGQS